MLDLFRHAFTDDPLTAALLFSYSDLLASAGAVSVVILYLWTIALPKKPRRVQAVTYLLAFAGASAIVCAVNVIHAASEAFRLRGIVATQDYGVGFWGGQYSVYMHAPDVLVLGKPVRGLPRSATVVVDRDRIAAVERALVMTGDLKHAHEVAGATARR